MVDVIPVLQFFSRRDLVKARRVLEVRRSDQRTADALEREVIIPIMDHINFITGHSNVPSYFAWKLLHALRDRV